MQRVEQGFPLPTSSLQERVAVAKHRLHPVANSRHGHGEARQPGSARCPEGGPLCMFFMLKLEQRYGGVERSSWCQEYVEIYGCETHGGEACELYLVPAIHQYLFFLRSLSVLFPFSGIKCIFVAQSRLGRSANDEGSPTKNRATKQPNKQSIIFGV